MKDSKRFGKIFTATTTDQQNHVFIKVLCENKKTEQSDKFNQLGKDLAEHLLNKSNAFSLTTLFLEDIEEEKRVFDRIAEISKSIEENIGIGDFQKISIKD